jgi:succinoglycan biosynthesis transport protein ExoP
MKSYDALIHSPSVLQPVIDTLRLPQTVNGLSKKVSASTPLNTVLINVTATDKKAARSAGVANAVSTSLAAAITKVEVAPGAKSSNVVVTTTKPATVPGSPVSPRPLFNTVIGLIVGLILGLLLGFVSERLDSTIKSRADLKLLLGSEPLGVVPLYPNAKQSPLIILDERSPRGEVFRLISTSLQFVHVDLASRCLVVTSARRGEGRTTLACNLAIAASQSGQKVCIVDADLRKPAVAGYLGLPETAGLADVLAQRVPLEDALVAARAGSFTFLPGGTSPAAPSELLSSQRMRALMADLRERFDLVIVD